MLGLGLGVDKIRPSGGVDPAITALLAQAATDGYTAASGSTLTALDTYVKGLKADGIWDKLDILYVFATNGDSDFATYNIKDPANFQATKVNAPTFTTDEGFAGDGTTSYLNTNWTPSADAINYVLNSASYGMYRRVDPAGFKIEMGAVDSTAQRSYLQDAVSGNNLGAAINNGLVADVQSGISGVGFWMANRSASNNRAIYRNGVSLNSDTTVSTSLPDRSYYVLANNNIGTANSFSNSQISIVFAGADLSAEASDFYTHTQNYMTALGKEV